MADAVDQPNGPPSPPFGITPTRGNPFGGNNNVGSLRLLGLALPMTLVIILVIRRHRRRRRLLEEAMMARVIVDESHAVVMTSVRALPVRIVQPGEEEKECAVCLQPIQPGDRARVLRCRHEFHQACLDKWLDSKHTRDQLRNNGMQPKCPLCKAPLTGSAEERPNTSSVDIVADAASDSSDQENETASAPSVAEMEGGVVRVQPLSDPSEPRQGAGEGTASRGQSAAEETHSRGQSVADEALNPLELTEV